MFLSRRDADDIARRQPPTAIGPDGVAMYVPAAKHETG